MSRDAAHVHAVTPANETLLEVITPTAISPAAKFAEVSHLRLEMELLNKQIVSLGDGLFCCYWHNLVLDIPLDDSGKSRQRPVCPECERPMKHVLTEL